VSQLQLVQSCQSPQVSQAEGDWRNREKRKPSYGTAVGTHLQGSYLPAAGQWNFVMAKKPNLGIIEDEVLYTAEAIREIAGKSLPETKRWIRENCIFSEPWEGNLWVTGLDFKRAIIECGKIDTPEAKAERHRKSGASRRPKKEATA
jgi:hypothetical protein